MRRRAPRGPSAVPASGTAGRSAQGQSRVRRDRLGPAVLHRTGPRALIALTALLAAARFVWQSPS